MSDIENMEVLQKPKEEEKPSDGLAQGVKLKAKANTKKPRESRNTTKIDEDQKCFYCEKVFQDLPNLKKHIQESHKDYFEYKYREKDKCGAFMYTCPECKFVGILNDLRIHYKRKHTGGKADLFHCRYCNVAFASPHERWDHASTHLDKDRNVNFDCQECPHKFENPSEYAAHFKEHYAARPYGCHHCIRRFNQAAVCANHELKDHPDKLSSADEDMIDGLTLKERADLIQRGYLEFLAPGPERHTNNRLAFICKECGKKVYGTWSLSEHLKAHKGGHLACEFCDFTTHQMCRLKYHRVIHLEERNEVCNICGETFKDISKLRQHAKVHTKKEQCKCKNCGKEFEDKYTLTSHLNKDHGGTLKCIFCDQLFKTKEIRRKHEQDSHPEKLPQKCEICGERFQRVPALVRHKMLHEPIPQKCTKCEETFPDEYHLQQHMQDRHNGYNPFECADCEKSFTKKDGLVRHMKTIHSDKIPVAGEITEKEKMELELRGFLDQLAPGPERNKQNELGFICQQCGNKVFGTEMFKVHLYTHEENRYQCSLCSFVTKHACMLERHMISHTEKREVICEMCGQTFKDEHTLTSHYKTVHTKKKYCKCRYCGMEFQDDYTHRLHVKKEHGGDHKCNFCEQQFTDISIRNKHEQDQHPDKLPIKCEKCGERFRKNLCLTSHMKGFHRPIPESCLDCNQVFEDKYSLLQHVTVAHKDYKHFECSLCGMRFDNLSHLGGHIRQVHNDVESPRKRKNSSTNHQEKTKKRREECDEDNDMRIPNFDMAGVDDHLEQIQTDHTMDTLEGPDMVSTMNSDSLIDATTSAVEYTVLPMSAVIYREMLSNENSIFFAWTKRLEPDLVRLASQLPGKCFMITRDEHPIPLKLKALNNRHKLNKIHVPVTLGHKNVSMDFNVYYFGNPISNIQDNVKRTWNNPEAVSLVRTSNLKIRELLESNVQSRIIVCNS